MDSLVPPGVDEQVGACIAAMRARVEALDARGFWLFSGVGGRLDKGSFVEGAPPAGDDPEFDARCRRMFRGHAPARMCMVVLVGPLGAGATAYVRPLPWAGAFEYCARCGAAEPPGDHGCPP